MVGDWVGEVVGLELLGENVGALSMGERDGVLDGLVVVGISEGKLVVGMREGRLEGRAVGFEVGTAEGFVVVGDAVGVVTVGTPVGMPVDGLRVGLDVVGDALGVPVVGTREVIKTPPRHTHTTPCDELHGSKRTSCSVTMGLPTCPPPHTVLEFQFMQLRRRPYQ